MLFQVRFKGKRYPFFSLVVSYRQEIKYNQLVGKDAFFCLFLLMDKWEYPLILDGGLATELERSFGKDLSGKWRVDQKMLLLEIKHLK